MKFVFLFLSLIAFADNSKRVPKDCDLVESYPEFRITCADGTNVKTLCADCAAAAMKAINKQEIPNLDSFTTPSGEPVNGSQVSSPKK